MTYQRYPAYIDCDIPWLTQVPAHWQVRRLRHVCQINPPKSEVATLASDTEVSFVPMEAVGEYGGLNLDQVKQIQEVLSGYTYFRNGDIVVAKITPCFENGKGALAEELTNEVAFGTTELHVLRAGECLDRHYLFYLSISERFRRLGEGEMYGAGGQKRVPDSYIRDFRQGIPPLPEQKAIVSFLDRELAQVDDLVAKQEQLLARLQEKRQTLIFHTVTKGLDPSVPMRDSGVKWLGEIPAHWETLKLKRIASLKSGDSIDGEQISDHGKYPVFGGNGIRGYSDKDSHNGHFILIGRQGALCGNINYSKGKFWATEHAVVVSPLTEWITNWLGELLRAMNLNQYSISAAQPGLSVDFIANLLVPYPPIAEQQCIATFLEQETAKIDTLIAKQHEFTGVLQERRSALITAAVTGQIDVRCTEKDPR